MRISGSEDLKTNIQDKELCVYCGACTEICPYFKTYNGKISMVFPCTIPAGRCYANCPKIDVDLDELHTFLYQRPYSENPLGNYLSIKISRAGEAYTHRKFQNGGSVSSLISFAMKEKIIDAAILTGHSGMTPTPVIVTDPSSVAACAGSKYMASPTISALNRSIEKGYRKIGVVGTPCQMTALTQIQMNPLERDYNNDAIALSIGLFCTWALDPKTFLNYLVSQVDIKTIKGIDIPPPPAGVMVIKTESTDLTLPLEDVRKHILNGCAFCPDMTAEFSDISVGAFEDDPAFNTLIIRSERGKQLVEKAEKEGFLILDDIPETSLSHLEAGSGNKKKRAFVKAQEEGLLNTDNSRFSLFRTTADIIKAIIS